MGGYSDYSECQLHYKRFPHIHIKAQPFLLSTHLFKVLICTTLTSLEQNFGSISTVCFCVRLLEELLGPIVFILSFLLGNQGGMGSSYYGGGGGGGSRGSMNGLGGGWGM